MQHVFLAVLDIQHTKFTSNVRILVPETTPVTQSASGPGQGPGASGLWALGPGPRGRGPGARASGLGASEPGLGSLSLGPRGRGPRGPGLLGPGPVGPIYAEPRTLRDYLHTYVRIIFTGPLPVAMLAQEQVVALAPYATSYSAHGQGWHD